MIELDTSPTINGIAQKAFNNAKAAGFHEKPIDLGTRLMLIVSELSEALEADRHDKRASSIVGVSGWIEDNVFMAQFEKHIKDTFDDEIADAIIRLLELSAFMNIDIGTHIETKLRYNSLRPFKHGGKKY